VHRAVAGLVVVDVALGEAVTADADEPADLDGRATTDR
jgi:hypothetical protein